METLPVQPKMGSWLQTGALTKGVLLRSMAGFVTSYYGMRCRLIHTLLSLFTPPDEVTQGRAVGVAHYLLGGIVTTWAF